MLLHCSFFLLLGLYSRCMFFEIISLYLLHSGHLWFFFFLNQGCCDLLCTLFSPFDWIQNYLGEIQKYLSVPMRVFPEEGKLSLNMTSPSHGLVIQTSLKRPNKKI